MSAPDQWKPPVTPPPYVEGDAAQWALPATGSAPSRTAHYASAQPEVSPYAAPPSSSVVAPGGPYPAQPGYGPQSGYPAQPGYGQAYPQQPYPQASSGIAYGAGTNGMSIASLACSVLSLGLLGVIFGHIALHQIKRTGQQGRGMAIAGVILGYAGVAFSVLSVMLLVFLDSGS